MPEREVSHDKLRVGVSVLGWLLTCWVSVLSVLSLTTHTVVGDGLHRLGAPPWLMPATLFAVAVLLVCSRITRSARLLTNADLAGAVMCMTAGSIAAYAAMNGDNASVSAANWVLISGLFLVHASVLSSE